MAQKSDLAMVDIVQVNSEPSPTVTALCRLWNA